MSVRRRWLLITISVSLGLAIALAAVEVALRAMPKLIPAWYSLTLPSSGIELVTPGVLERTPIDGVPLPYGINHRLELTVPAPSDLEGLGLVAPHDNPDRDRYPALRFRVDRFGFFNPREMEEADILLVGDSFVVSTGILAPEWLQAGLENVTGLSVFNLAVPSIGPQREKYLLEEVGLDLDPAAVIWFFFAGNDIEDSIRLERHRSKGVVSYADLYPGRLAPRSISIGLLTAAFRSQSHARTGEPIPALRFSGRAGDEPVWFKPAYLRRLTRPREVIEDSPGWTVTKETLLKVSKTLKRRRIPLLVVYVPSKPQVYLPFVARDPELVHRMASFNRAVVASPGALLHLALTHRNNLDGLLREHCRDHGIAYRSMTPHLVQLAREGRLGYMAADTHWNEVGQGAALPVLKTWIDGVRDRSSGPRR